MSAYSVEYPSESTATFGQSTDSESVKGTPVRAMAVRATPGSSHVRSASAGPVSGGTVMITKLEPLPAPAKYGPQRSRGTTPQGARVSPAKGKPGTSPKPLASVSAAEGSGVNRAQTPLRYNQRDPLFSAMQKAKGSNQPMAQGTEPQPSASVTAAERKGEGPSATAAASAAAASIPPASIPLDRRSEKVKHDAPPQETGELLFRLRNPRQRLWPQPFWHQQG